MWSMLTRDPSAKNLRRGVLLLGVLGLVVIGLLAVGPATTGVSEAKPRVETAKPAAKAPELVSTSRLFTGLLTVGGLIAAAAWAARRFLKGTRFTPRGGKVLEIVDALPLGARRQVFVISAYGRKLVVGATPEGLSLLSEFNEEEVHASRELEHFAGELGRQLATGEPRRANDEVIAR